VADRFGKRPGRVLEKMRDLECSLEFRERNFQGGSYKDVQGQMRPQQLMTRDGFLLLVMHFTGKKAAYAKERFIEAFNAMEEELIRSKAVGVADVEKFLVENLRELKEIASGQQTTLVKQDGRINHLEERMTQIEVTLEKRKKLATQTEKEHRLIILEFYDGKCPCCQENQVVDSQGRRIPGAEYDHSGSRARKDLKHTWLICKTCHDKFPKANTKTPPVWSRAEKKDVFATYQQRVSHWLTRNVAATECQRELFC
jgi:Rha family phage regulatory protein